MGVITGMESFSVSLSGDLSDTNRARFTGLGGAVFVSSLSFCIVSMNIGGGGITLPVEATLAIDCFLASGITLGGGGAGRVGESLTDFHSELSPGDCGLFILLVEIFFGTISFVGTVLCGGTGRWECSFGRHVRFGGGGGFRFLLGKLCFVSVLYGSTPAGGAGAGLRGRFNL